MSHRGIIIIAIMLSLLGISISYASLSLDLSISGTASVNLSGWDIQFNSLQPVVLTGEALEVNAPVLNGNSTTLSGFDIKYYMPGDSAAYQFTIVNFGTLDAKIGAISLPTPTCSGSGVDEITDEQTVCDNFKFKLSYVGGINDGQVLAIDDTLNASESKTVKLELEFNGNKIINESVMISNLNATINYVQS